MSTGADLTRREFLKTAALSTAGLVVAFYVPLRGRFAHAAEAPPAGPAKLAPANAFLRIAPDDTITVLLAHSEMGQGIWTSLPMLIAEELDADWSKFRVEHAPAAPAYAHTACGIQATGGSSTTPSEFDRYRQVGAAARALLVQAAAQRLGVAPADCRTENGTVVAGGQRLRYGELAEEAARLPMPATVTLKDPKDWKVIGQPTRRLDTPEKIDGRAVFGLDVRFDGLLTAVVERSPVFGGKVKSFDATAARAVPGVRKVVQVPSGVAVVADHFWAAKQGREALKIEWDLGAGATLDSGAMLAEFRRLAAHARRAARPAPATRPRRSRRRSAGRRPSTSCPTSRTHRWSRSIARCASARTAARSGPARSSRPCDQASAAQITGLKPEQVELHTTFLGGGFGRRGDADSDWVSEAVHVAKAAGAPVKTVWTREDDVRGGYYRPMFLHRVAGRARRRRHARWPGTTRWSASRCWPVRRSRRLARTASTRPRSRARRIRRT